MAMGDHIIRIIRIIIQYIYMHPYINKYSIDIPISGSYIFQILSDEVILLRMILM